VIDTDPVTDATVPSPAAPSSPTAAPGASPYPRWRRILAAVLIVISCVLIPISGLAIWVRNQLLDTGRYVETVTPLAQNQAIIDTASQRITQTLFDNVDVAQVAKDALPARADFLAGPLAAGTKQLVEQLSVRVLESDRFQQVWVDANRIAHTQVENALTGGGKVISTRNGKVSIDLSAVYQVVKQALADRGISIFDKIPINALSLRFELFDAKSLGQAQTGVDLLRKAAWVLPVLAFVLLGVGLWLSPHRRKTLVRWGIGVATAVAILGAAITIGRYFYLDAVVSATLPRATAAAVFDILVRYLRQGVRAVAVAALLVALIAWVTGSGKAAVRVRTTFAEVFGGLGDRAESVGWNFGGFGRFVHTYRNPVLVAGVFVGLLTLVFADRVSAGRILLTTLGVLLYVGVVQFVSRAADVGETGSAAGTA
jgi:hypothetical protein